ncbi:TfoX/Sxy family protein [Nocardia sp. NPDC127579]|uniref:TfoX/Sxy family protein n=1 Tax=Nocardia sp. NPDC127579 TaxID=3345402 RepID=UPI003632592D
MAYDEELAERIRELIEPGPHLVEKKMFGGLGFMVDGHMAVAASGQGGLLARVDPAEEDDLLEADHVEIMIMAGREAHGWLRVRPEGLATDQSLRDWVARSVAYARSLPPKKR